MLLVFDIFWERGACVRPQPPPLFCHVYDKSLASALTIFKTFSLFTFYCVIGPQKADFHSSCGGEGLAPDP